MRIEDRVVEALIAELERQASEPKRGLSIDFQNPPEAVIRGRVDMDKLAMVVMGTLAGGP